MDGVSGCHIVMIHSLIKEHVGDEGFDTWTRLLEQSHWSS